MSFIGTARLTRVKGASVKGIGFSHLQWAFFKNIPTWRVRGT